MTPRAEHSIYHDQPPVLRDLPAGVGNIPLIPGEDENQ